MFSLFKKKESRRINYQKTFVEVVNQLFSSDFESYNFTKIKEEYSSDNSTVVFKKEEKYILFFSIDDIDYRGEGNYYDVVLGEKFNNDLNGFDGYNISIERLSKIIDPSKKSRNYNFPYSRRKAYNLLASVKEDMFNYASFYLTSEEDLFDKVLKLKGIRR